MTNLKNLVHRFYGRKCYSTLTSCKRSPPLLLSPRMSRCCWTGPVSRDNVLSSPYGRTREPDQTVTEYIFEHHKKFADKPAITCGASGRTYSYGLLRLMIDKFAMALLSEVGLKPKETIALVLPNIPEYVAAINGSMEAGLQVTFANPLYTADELLRQFQICNVKAIVTVEPLLQKCLDVKDKLVDYKGTIVIGQDELEKDGIFGFRGLLIGGSKSPLPRVRVDDIALVPFSSGTTGMPKGVLLTHRNLVVNLMQVINPVFCKPNKPNTTFYPMPEGSEGTLCTKDGQWYLPGNHDTVLTVPPFFHIYGYNGILNYSLRIGNHVVSLPSFSPEGYLSCLRKYKPKGIFVVPSLLALLGTHPAVTREDLSCVEHIVVGAAPTTESIVEKFFQKCGRGRDEITIQQGFGMTESSPVATLSPLNAPVDKVVSVGQLIHNTEARIVSLTDGKNLGSNERGELYIRGPQVMQGYLNNLEATRETIDSEGWLHTGDVAYYDDQHFFYVVDRTKELIKVKGNQVSPTELESIIMEMPAVADAAVIGIPEEIAGEIPKAYVVLRKNSELSSQEVYNWVKERVVKYKRLDGGVEFIDSIPRNPGGKIMRNQLKTLGNTASS